MSDLTNMLHNIANTFSGFVSQLSPEAQAEAAAAVTQLHAFADTEVAALVTKAAGPIFSPIVLAVLAPAIDTAINDLNTLKAQAAAPTSPQS